MQVFTHEKVSESHHILYKPVGLIVGPSSTFLFFAGRGSLFVGGALFVASVLGGFGTSTSVGTAFQLRLFLLKIKNEQYRNITTSLINI